MRASRPAVHPVEAPAPAPAAVAQPQAQAQAEGELVAHPRGVRMKDPPGAPGTPAGLGLRLAQVFFAAAALAVMASTNDFPSVSAFRSDASLYFLLSSRLRQGDRLFWFLCTAGLEMLAISQAFLACEISRALRFSFQQCSRVDICGIWKLSCARGWAMA